MPEVSAKEEALCLVVLECREERCIRVSLWCPLAGPKMSRSGIRDHRKIDRWDRSAKASVRHVARHARLISIGGHVAVDIHQLAESFYSLSPGSLTLRPLTCQNTSPPPVP